MRLTGPLFTGERMMLQTFKVLRWALLGVSAVGLVWLAGHSPVLARDQAGRPEVGDAAVDFELGALDAEKVQLSKLVEDGPVVLVVLRGYPGYQCPVCNAQVGQFLASAEKFQAAKARVVLIYPGPAGGLKNHAAEFVRGKTLPNHVYLLLDPDFKFTESYGLRWNAPNETAYPATFVIDGQRKIQFAKIIKTHGGRASAEEVLKALKRE
jgi:peroxiredoxin